MGKSRIAICGLCRSMAPATRRSLSGYLRAQVGDAPGDLIECSIVGGVRADATGVRHRPVQRVGMDGTRPVAIAWDECSNPRLLHLVDTRGEFLRIWHAEMVAPDLRVQRA